MSIAELIRAVESKKRVIKQQAQEKATFDYILADLIGRSIGRLYSNSTHLPDVSEIYPTLFDNQQIEENKQSLSQNSKIVEVFSKRLLYNEYMKISQ